MRLLFFSADVSEVEQARIELRAAGIECELRHSPSPGGIELNPASLELWIRRDQDAYRAVMKCVELGIGFARKATKVICLEDLEEERRPSARAA